MDLHLHKFLDYYRGQSILGWWHLFHDSLDWVCGVLFYSPLPLWEP